MISLEGLGPPRGKMVNQALWGCASNGPFIHRGRGLEMWRLLNRSGNHRNTLEAHKVKWETNLVAVFAVELACCFTVYPLTLLNKCGT